jgi:2-polyprenyl-3-methyl-5-hydroxy-6-metoxy-1,4-benzoquinol methylase
MSSHISCPLCFNKIEIAKYNGKHQSIFNGQEYRLYYCSLCTTSFWSPLKTIPEFYESSSLAMYSQMHAGLKKLPRHCLRFFESMPVKDGQLLDIGCGDGIFLHNVRKSNTLTFDLFGLDFDKKSVEAAKNKYGLVNTYSVSLKEFLKKADELGISFDVITFFDVLEHQDEPRVFLQNAMSLLKPGGYIAGSVPNASRYFAGLDRKNSNIDFPPHHFIYFTEYSLRYFIKSEGFEYVKILPVQLDLSDMIVLVENLLLGRFSNYIREKFTRTNMNKSSKLVHDKVAITNAIGIKSMLIKIRNIILAPLALCIFTMYNKRGPQLYFQARKKHDKSLLG